MCVVSTRAKDIPKFIYDRMGEDGCIVCTQQGVNTLSMQINKRTVTPVQKRKTEIGKGYEQANKDTKRFAKLFMK